MTVLDVGQGLAVVLQTRRHNLLYDTGPTPMAGERVVLPYLTGAGIRKIETLVLSHNDSDHTGGAEGLMRRLPVDRLLYSALPEGYQPDDRTRQAFCRAGEGWQEDSVDFRFLSPGPGLSGAADNNRSCVLRVSGPGFSLLLTGDIEKETEAALIDEGALEPVDVLVLPHHGSKTSSTAAFIEALHPRRGVISSGYRNRFGHPSPVVVQRYREAGVALDSTIPGGTLVYEWMPGHPMTLYRERDRRHYWRISP
jgi:competence protein ComEC